jgi:hypothetical protein
MQGKGEHGQQKARARPSGAIRHPDGSRADIEDVISEFVDFGGNPAYGHLATRANDSMVRVIVGKLGAGKTVYLRRLQAFQAHQDSVYADVPQQTLPKTEVVVKACQWFSNRVLVEKWMQIWERAIIRSLASHVLRHPELRQQMDEVAVCFMRIYPARAVGSGVSSGRRANWGGGGQRGRPAAGGLGAQGMGAPDGRAGAERTKEAWLCAGG